MKLLPLATCSPALVLQFNSSDSPPQARARPRASTFTQRCAPPWGSETRTAERPEGDTRQNRPTDLGLDGARRAWREQRRGPPPMLQGISRRAAGGRARGRDRRRALCNARLDVAVPGGEGAENAAQRVTGEAVRFRHHHPAGHSGAGRAGADADAPASMPRRRGGWARVAPLAAHGTEGATAFFLRRGRPSDWTSSAREALLTGEGRVVLAPSVDGPAKLRAGVVGAPHGAAPEEDPPRCPTPPRPSPPLNCWS